MLNEEVYTFDLKDFPFEDLPSGGTSKRISPSEMAFVVVRLNNHDQNISDLVTFKWYKKIPGAEPKLLYTGKGGDAKEDPSWTWWWSEDWSLIGHFGWEINEAGSYHVDITSEFGNARVAFEVTDSRPKKVAAPIVMPIVIQPAPTPTPNAPQVIPSWPGVPKIEPKPITPPTPSQETPKPIPAPLETPTPTQSTPPVTNPAQKVIPQWPGLPNIPAPASDEKPAPTPTPIEGVKYNPPAVGKGKIVSLTVQQGGYTIFEPCDKTKDVLYPYQVSAGKWVCITVKIQNSGDANGEFRVHLAKPDGSIIDKEPDTFWKDLAPGDVFETTLNAYVSDSGVFKPVLEVRRCTKSLGICTESIVDESRVLEFNAKGTAPIIPGLPPIIEPVKKAIEEVITPTPTAPTPVEAGEPKPSTQEKPQDDTFETSFPLLLAVIAAIVVFMMLRK